MTKFVQLLLFGFLLPKVSNAVLRGTQERITLPGPPRPREIDGFRDFVPLSCNANLPKPGTPCPSFSSKFGKRDNYDRPITIPCSECYDMDLSGTAIFHHGLFVEGKLVFPERLNLRVVSPMIIVQGELEMYATETAVNGKPNIVFEMVGENDKQAFTPVSENRYGCSEQEPTCVAGKKAIVVAGGKVTMRGLPPNTPTWTKLRNTVWDFDDGKQTKALLIDKAVAGKWAAGADILITSHTRGFDAQQERKIFYISPFGPDLVQIILDRPISRPITVRESPEFAVEVALLSRNILFEGGTDSTPRHGGHFWIMHTPNVIQTVEGIEVRNFGQEGNLGRYPIHFHFNNEGQGSVIAKNTVRDSNQRCIVVHGTNNLLIEENIAFRTTGHCFMTEDGMETGNRFVRNLGAHTRMQVNRIGNHGPNGIETDHEPATFWIPSTQNVYIENVAAGSQSSGFWIEPLLRGTRKDMYNFDPMRAPLTLFKDNVAHSNEGKNGAIRMYTPGYLPDEIASFDGLKVYRNNASGLFLHKNYNIVVENAVFADNNMAIDIDRATGITIRNTRIIGESESFRKIMKSQNVDPPCVFRKIVGIDLHTWKLDNDHTGVDLSGLSFSGFSNTACRPKVLEMDQHTLKQGMFELFTSIRNSTMDAGPESIDMCDARLSDTGKPYDIYLVDSDGSFSPPSVSPKPTEPSVLISTGEAIGRFIRREKCTPVEAGCYMYCRDTCFQSVRIEAEPRGTDRLKLEVRRRGHAKTAEFSWGRRENGNRDGDDTARTFIAHLPTNEFYNARFIDEVGNEVRPQILSIEYEESLCSKDDDFQVDFPGTEVQAEARDECQNLIANSDMEDGWDGYWKSSMLGRLTTVQGYRSNTAIQHIGFPFSTGPSYLTEDHMNYGCLTVDSTWTISAQVKLTEAVTGAGVACGRFCPRVNFIVYNSGGVVFEVRSRDYVSGWNSTGFNQLITEFKVPRTKWNGISTRVEIFIDGYNSLHHLALDDFAITTI